MSISYGLNLGIMNGASDGDLYGDDMRAFQRACDAFLQPIVKGYLTNTPPGSPVDGAMYIVGSAPTGSWASYAGYVAKWSSLIAAWEFYLPKNGWQFQSNSAREIYRRTGGVWEIYYQEGTWTPSWVGQTTAGVFVYAVQAGNYIKIGSSITAFFRIQISSTTTPADGELRIHGLPFTTGNVSGAGIVSSNTILSLAASRYVTVPQPLALTATARIWQVGPGDTLVVGSQLGAVGTITGQMFYNS